MNRCGNSKKSGIRTIKEGKDNWKIVSSIQQTDKKIWNALAGHKQFLHTEYLQALEESSIAGFTYRYALRFENRKPVAALYFQLADLSSKDAGSIVNMDQYGKIMQAIASGINDLLLSGKKYTGNHLLVCGNMLVTGDHGIACKAEHLHETMQQLPGLLYRMQKDIENENGRVVAALIKDFYEPEMLAASLLQKAGFHPLQIDPNMKIAIHKEWKTFDDYLQALSAKYRLRANNTRTLCKGLVAKELSAEEIIQHAAVIESLYLQVVGKAPVLIVRAHAGFFVTMKKRLKEHYVFRAFYQNGTMIAFTTGYYFESLEAHFIGMDYQLSKEHQLYQYILYDFIECAIRHRKKELNYGRTAIEIKSTVGAAPHELIAYLKINSAILHRVVGAVLPFFKNGKYIIRQPFKELKK
jgi:predicted N-acyltransferase